jgi:DNA helicase-2/ATP-dependent DNA helicase PcrA
MSHSQGVQNQMDRHNDAFLKLNDKQREAVMHIDGPVLVLAGPGTGKTEVLAVRIGQILKQQDVRASNILCLTYSNAAVQAMRKRLLHLIGPDAEKIAIYTYHSLCNKLINENASDIFSGKTLITDAQRHMLIEKMIYDHLAAMDPNYLKPASSKKVNDLASIFSTLKQEGITSDQLLEIVENCIQNILPLEEKYLTQKGVLNYDGRKLQDRLRKFGSEISEMYVDYNQQLESRKKFEFEDMLIEGVLLLEADNQLKTRLHEQYQYILIDEFQDTNAKQLALIDQICSEVIEPNIFAVGDDDQCIYRFQGANRSNFQWMRNKFQRLRTIVLDINYRSTATILQESFELIAENGERQPEKNAPLIAGNEDYQDVTHQPSVKVYENAEQEAYALAKHIFENSDGQYNGIAILARKHKEFELVMRWLDHYSIPYKANRNWINLLDTPFGKSIYNLLQFIRCHEENSRMAEGFLIQFFLHKKYGRELLKTFLLSKKQKAKSLYEWLLGENNADPKLSNLTRSVQELYEIRTELDVLPHLASLIDLAKKDLTIPTMVQEVEVLSDFVASFVASDRQKNLISLANMFWYHEQNGINIRVELGIQEEDGENCVILSTIHGSKGLQYDTVFLIGCHSTNWEDRSNREGINVPDLLNRYIVPEPDSLDDMRRLIYVACTRAKTRLNISYFRKNYNDKDLWMTILLNNFKNSDRVHFEEVANFEIPKRKNDCYIINADDELTSLVNERLSEFEISPTSTGTWERCQNEFFFNAIMKIPGTSAEAPSFGTLVHEVLQIIAKEHFRQHDDHFVNAIVDQQMEKLKLSFHPTRISRYSQYGKWLIREYIRRYPFVKRPEHIEDDFHYILENGAKVKGKLDRVEAYDIKVKVIDYKTGRNKNPMKTFVSNKETGTQYWRQANIYSRLMLENFPGKDAYDFEFHYPENNHVITPFTFEANDAFDEWIGEIWKSLRFQSQCEDPTCVYCLNKFN